MKESYIKETIFFITLITLVSSIPLFNDFLWWEHSFIFEADRIENITQSLFVGNFPVRINYISTFGIGVATPIMYPELFLYIPAILMRLGVSQMISLKLFFILINLACTCLSYYSAKNITKSRHIGLIFSCIYSLCLYRFTDSYLRLAVGESLAMAFIPLVMLGIYEIVCNDSKNWKTFAIGITCVLQSHVISIYLVTIFLVLFCLLFVKNLNKQRIFSLLKSVFAIICLNLWFLIPFATYFSLVETPPPISHIKETAVYLTQMFATFVKNEGYDLFHLGSTQNEMPLTLGGLVALGIVIFIYFAFIKNDALYKKNNIIKIGKFFLFLGIIALFAASTFFPYENKVLFFLFNRIQFSWRFFVIAAPLLSFAASIGFYLFLKKVKVTKELSVLIVFCFGVLNCAYYIDSCLQLEPFTINEHIWVHGDYKYKNSTIKKDSIFVSNTEIAIDSTKRNMDKFMVFFNDKSNSENAYMELPIFNFPGYKVYSDWGELGVSNGNNNFIRIALPKNKEGVLFLQYEESPLFVFGNLVSIATVLFFVYGFVRKKQND